MENEALLKTIFENLESAATQLRAKAGLAESRDCLQSCSDKYDSCMSSAGSDMEKAVCNSAYTRCASNC